ncbi:MAG: hypothetical protein H0W62_02385 [Chitinophagales bacterium]|nr:hypothetical protein [Chitinophagales bacterium]
MKNLKLSLTILLLAGIGVFSACQKDQMNTDLQNEDITREANVAFADHQSAYVDALTQAVSWNVITPLNSASVLSPCSTVTYDTSSVVKTVTIDFGSVPCQVPNGEEFRQGTLIITWTGNMLDSGTVKTITPQNYYVGDSASRMNKFEFSKTITNMGKNEKGNTHFLVEMKNATLTLWDGGTITWNGNHDREWVQGAQTPNRSDDVFLITGGSNGIDRKGEPFTAEILKPLRKDDCEWIVSGTKIVTHGDNSSRTIDYGDGNCDDLATVTLSNGTTRTIHIDKP